MKDRCYLTLTITLAAAVVWLGVNGSTRAEESATVPTDPGFNANTGQINPGVEQQASSQPKERIDIPTPEVITSGASGAVLKAAVAWQHAQCATSGRPNGRRAKYEAGIAKCYRGAGRAHDSRQHSGPDRRKGRRTSGVNRNELYIFFYGRRAASVRADRFVRPDDSAKFSNRNDVLDRTPIMAWPLPLSDQQRMQIYDAVMSDTSQPVAGADALKPTSELSPDQALNGMRPLPESVRSIDGVERLYYLKTKRKVLLVEPAIRTVIGEIGG